jgi:hypothetical protein
MFYVVNLGGTYKVWGGTSAGVLLFLEDNPGAQVDITPFETEAAAEQRRAELSSAVTEN